MILVTADERVRMERLRSRGLSEEQTRRRLGSQYTNDEKLRRIRARIAEARWGRLVEVESSRELDDAAVADVLARAARS